MAIAYDATTNNFAQTTSYSFTHTPVGTPAGVIVLITYNGETTDNILTCTYGGVAMTDMGHQTGASSENFAQDVYFLGSSIPTGAQTVAVTTTNSRNTSISVYTVTASGDTEVHVQDSTSINGDLTSPQSAVLGLTSEECFVVEAIFSGQNAVADVFPLAASNWTDDHENDHGGNCSAAYRYTVIGSSDVTFGFDFTAGTEDAGVFVIAVKEAASISAAVTGTATPSATEAEIRTGGETVILTLTGDTWVAAGATFDAQRQNIIDGLDAASSPTNGWNNEVRDNLAVGTVVRTSDTVVTVTLSAQSGYNIESTNETITATIPASALVTSASAVVATPTFDVTGVAPTAAITGTVTSAFEEDDVVAGGDTIIITLTGGSFKAAGTGPIGSTADTQALIDNIDSAQAEANGWDAVVKTGLSTTDVVRTSSTVATITLPAFGTYSITANETITVTVPSDVLDDWDANITGSPTFEVANSVPKTITQTEQTDRRVFQRNSGSASITVSGTYTGAVASVEARIVDDGTTNEVVAWTVIDSSPTGGTFSGVISVPEGGWYNVDVRFSNDVSITDDGANKFGVGILVGFAGSSHVTRMFNQGSAQTPNDTVSKYDGTWAVLGAASEGATAFSDALQAGLTTSVPVGMLDYGFGASTIGADWDDKTDPDYSTFVSAVTAVGGELEFIVWAQGGADVIALTSQASYESSFNSLVTNWREDITNRSDETNLPILVVQQGRRTDGTDAAVQDIRNAMDARVAALDDVYLGATIVDLPMVDASHLTAGGYGSMGTRTAQCVLFLLDEETYYLGPTVTEWGTNSQTETEITIAHVAGTDFTPTTGITGFIVWDGGTPETISAAVRTDATTITLTHGAVTGAKTVSYHYGNADVTAPVIDNTALALALRSNGVIAQAAATAVIAGDTVMTVQDVVDGGKQITITLDNDSFLPAGTGPIGTTAQTQALIDGISAATSPAGGWNAQVRDNMVPATHVVRTSDTVATITFPAAAGYTEVVEVVGVTVPTDVLQDSASGLSAGSLTIGVINSTVSDEILRATGGPTINDGLASHFGKTTSESLQDAEFRWLGTQGGTAGTIPDRWNQVLTGLGYSGTLDDMKLLYWLSQ